MPVRKASTISIEKDKDVQEKSRYEELIERPKKVRVNSYSSLLIISILLVSSIIIIY